MSQSEPLATPTNLARGQLLPDFTLLTSDGEPLRISDFRGQRNLILVFAGDPAQDVSTPLLSALARRHTEASQEVAEVLAIVVGSIQDAGQFKEQLELPFPVLADSEGRVHRSYGAASDGGVSPLVYIADRFSEIHSVLRVEEGLPLPAVKEIMEWLAFLNSQRRSAAPRTGPI